MPDARRSYRLTVPALLVTLLLAGCDTRLSAPPLEDGPVYKNSREGFRFLVPEGWKQRARGEVPAGKVETERMLAEYKNMESYGILRITVVDIPLATPLSDYVSKYNLTGEKWRPYAPAEHFTINGAPAMRVLYVQGEGRQEMIREIVAFRRGERVYLFNGFYARVDSKSRKALRAAVDTIVW